LSPLLHRAVIDEFAGDSQQKHVCGASKVQDCYREAEYLGTDSNNVLVLMGVMVVHSSCSSNQDLIIA